LIIHHHKILSKCLIKNQSALNNSIIKQTHCRCQQNESNKQNTLQGLKTLTIRRFWNKLAANKETNFFNKNYQTALNL
jgi:hypothetical protein